MKDHIISERDLKKNPELAEKGIKVGDTIQIPMSVKEIRDEEKAQAKALKKDLGKAPSSGVPVMFEGVEVLSILQDGRETATDYHCKMANGTTMHVPKSLFNK